MCCHLIVMRSLVEILIGPFCVNYALLPSGIVSGLSENHLKSIHPYSLRSLLYCMARHAEDETESSDC